MTFEQFREAFEDLDFQQQLAIYNEWAYENNADSIYEFSEDFFEEMFYSNVMEAARATYFGEIQSWYDPYIKFNGYGNLESLTESYAYSLIDSCLEDIFDQKECWKNYINESDFEE